MVEYTLSSRHNASAFLLEFDKGTLGKNKLKIFLSRYNGL
jgi:hypothetical protein